MFRETGVFRRRSGGSFQPEWVATFARNGWQACSGISGRFAPEYAFTLAALLVDERDWLDTLDQLVAFRRYLKAQFQISPRQELKASWIVHGKREFAALSPAARKNVFRAAMRFQRKCGTIRTFAIVVNKAQIRRRDIDPRECAWMYAIERLERFGTAEQQNLHILPDEGHGYFIRKKLREMRRFHYVPSAFGSARLERKAANIVEDSSDRRSQESYFIQLADLNAYAALRRVHPKAGFDGAMWDQLGDIRVARVNRLSGGPPGIVSWPRQP